MRTESDEEEKQEEKKLKIQNSCFHLVTVLAL